MPYGNNETKKNVARPALPVALEKVMSKFQLPAEAAACGRKTLLLACYALAATLAVGFLIDTLPGLWRGFTANWGVWELESPIALYWSSWAACVASMVLSAWSFCAIEKVPDGTRAAYWLNWLSFGSVVAWLCTYVATGYSFDDLSSLSPYMLAGWLLLAAPICVLIGFVLSEATSGNMPFAVAVAIAYVVFGFICISLGLSSSASSISISDLTH